MFCRVTFVLEVEKSDVKVVYVSACFSWAHSGGGDVQDSAGETVQETD